MHRATHRVCHSQHQGVAAWCKHIGVGSLAFFLAVFLAAALQSALAQSSSPEIVAKERRDPAAGEVVIINRKKRSANAPDPYAPIKLKPLPEKWSDAKPKAKQPPKQVVKKFAPEQEVPNPVTAAPSSRPPLPPLPTLNRSQRAADARLRQFPQARLAPPPTSSAPTRIEEPPPPHREIGPSVRDRAAWRRYQERRRYRNRRRYSYRSRPWRQCRRLARRCRSGFEGSCIIWQRRCR